MAMATTPAIPANIADNAVMLRIVIPAAGRMVGCKYAGLTAILRYDRHWRQAMVLNDRNAAFTNGRGTSATATNAPMPALAAMANTNSAQ